MDKVDKAIKRAKQLKLDRAKGVQYLGKSSGTMDKEAKQTKPKNGTIQCKPKGKAAVVKGAGRPKKGETQLAARLMALSITIVILILLTTLR